MKKFFLFAAAVVAALTVNAKVYDFATITKADIQTTAVVTEDEATGKITIAIPGDQSVVEIRLFEDIVLHYNSKEAKNITVDTKNGYFEFPGNGATAEGKALVTVENLTIGDKVAFVLSERDDCKDNLKKILSENKNIKHLAIAVGSEGGISPQEVLLLEEKGLFHPIHFAVNILRCETAALYGIAAIQSAIN